MPAARAADHKVAGSRSACRFASTRPWRPAHWLIRGGLLDDWVKQSSAPLGVAEQVPAGRRSCCAADYSLKGHHWARAVCVLWSIWADIELERVDQNSEMRLLRTQFFDNNLS